MEIISQETIGIGQIKRHLQEGRAAVKMERESGNLGRLDIKGTLAIVDEIDRLIDKHAPGSLFAGAAHFQEVAYKSVVPRIDPFLDPCSNPPAREVNLSALIVIP